MDVQWGAWAPGDLIFSQWPGDDARPGHVVIYEGSGTTIAAPHTGTTVQEEPVSTFAAPHYVGSKRPAPLRGAQAYAALAAQDAGVNTQGSSSSGGLIAGLGVLPIILLGLGVLVVGGILLFKSRPQQGGEAGGAES